MAYSQVGIVNLALIRIKVPVIASMSESSSAATYASAVWEYVRDEVLEEHDWNFAKLTAELAQDTATPTDPKWDYRYVKPANCLKIRSIVDEGNTPYEYVEEGDYIYCNFDNSDHSLFMRYTTVITDPTKYSPSFINALAWRLAAELSLKLAAEGHDRCMREYFMSIAMAKGKNQARDYVEGEYGNTDWIDRA